MFQDSCNVWSILFEILMISYSLERQGYEGCVLQQGLGRGVGRQLSSCTVSLPGTHGRKAQVRLVSDGGGSR